MEGILNIRSRRDSMITEKAFHGSWMHGTWIHGTCTISVPPTRLPRASKLPCFFRKHEMVPASGNEHSKRLFMDRGSMDRVPLALLQPGSPVLPSSPASTLLPEK